MNLNELRILIETDQVNEIIFDGELLGKSYIYSLYVCTKTKNMSGKLFTGRTHEIKKYSSLDRAVKAMLDLGYKGAYRIQLS